MIHSLSHLPTLRSSRIAQFALILFLIVSPFIFSAPTAHALSVTLAWDPSDPNEDVAGYKIYFGTESQNYTTVIDVRDATMKSVTTLKKGMVYYFAATAYNSYGAESSFSEEVAVNTCTYKISPKKKTFKAIGGFSKVKVNTQPSCPWTAERFNNNDTWITIDEVTSGLGKGYIAYSVDSNPEPDARTGDLTIAEISFTVTQKGTGISN
jgi:fibronectin type 3 domain-containing protein